MYRRKRNFEESNGGGLQSTSAPVANLEARARKRKAEDKLFKEEPGDDHSVRSGSSDEEWSQEKAVRWYWAWLKKKEAQHETQALKAKEELHKSSDRNERSG